MRKGSMLGMLGLVGALTAFSGSGSSVEVGSRRRGRMSTRRICDDGIYWEVPRGIWHQGMALEGIKRNPLRCSKRERARRHAKVTAWRGK